MITLVVGTNTLGTLDGANQYFETTIHAARWAAISSATKKKQALVTAFNAMTQMSWFGEKTDSAQLAPFPRTDLLDAEGNIFDSAVIPLIAEYGQFELALYFAESGGYKNPASVKGQVKEVQAGTAKVKYFQTDQAVSAVPAFPKEVMQYFDILKGVASDIELEFGEALGVDQTGFFGNTEYDVSH